MPNEMEDIMLRRGWVPGRPLLGVTLLLVEDSRFASEGVRMMCQRLGARIRRAETLGSARKHLETYLPTVILIDIGLPDGSGLSLIRELSTAKPRIPVILGTSGDDGVEALAREAGADDFLTKPALSLRAFQDALLAHLPDEMKLPQVRLDQEKQIEPDPFALRDDIMHAADILAVADGDTAVDYVVQFIGGVARASRDMPLQRTVEKFGRQRARGKVSNATRTKLVTMLDARIEAARPI
ncbi:hypothetical protein ACMU_10575 [Actibacterium mucosum KCTC 23349]|uniref:Response regulatory domain-containing protein n=1 Tax=Actibacterium mucosum KCTC 23349 TaxID=1454373 RepID=A0A037ZJA1_9RHOB|nr:response regulator [Actibacterium mucosum]KAJ56188.1 hypothetical protein ACMU_10575 [Actibacterium mucosum KCTC 23349]